MGDALLDLCREVAGQECVKTFSYRSRLAEPANPTNLTCKICHKCKPHVLPYTLSNAQFNDTDVTAFTSQPQHTMSGTDGVTPAIS